MENTQMDNGIQITAKQVVNGEVTEEVILVNHSVTKVTSIDQLGFTHLEQIELLRNCQESLLKAQSHSLQSEQSVCPKCDTRLKFAGSVLSEFHSVFTDHKVSVRRKKCCNKACGWTSVPSISSLFNTNVHPDLAKLQTEMACNHTYRESEKIMTAMSGHLRKVNNHKHIHRTVELVGNYISEHLINDTSESVATASTLICQVDGGHLKSKDPSSRSFEVLTSAIYNPEHVKYPAKKETQILEKDDLPRGQILSKHCAASALDDDAVSIKQQTLWAARKEGMTVETHLIALCDGARNCWHVIESLEDQCGQVTKILDWFHIAKRFTHIVLPKYLTKKLDKLKWCIWHGKVEEGLSRFESIIEKTRAQKIKVRLMALQTYLQNNKDYLVNYSKRHQAGDVISSSFAESTVESLINKRCKGKQHMMWTREGAHPLLQVRACAASNDWAYQAENYVLKAITQ